MNALIVCLGLCQYLYILVRTRQHALDLEAYASNLTELLAVIRAQRFEDQMFRFGPHALVTERVPAVWWEILHEFGWSGTALIVAGLVLLFRQRPRHAVLLLLGLVGAVALALNVAADLKGFLVPAFVLAWPAVAPALDAARAVIDRWSRTAGSALVAAAGIALVGGLLHANFERTDRHRDTYFATYFDALFRVLPERTAFVAEDYTTDCMVHYQLIMSGRSRRVLLEALPPDPNIITALLRDGYRVMAFQARHRPVVAVGLYVPSGHPYGGLSGQCGGRSPWRRGGRGRRHGASGRTVVGGCPPAARRFLHRVRAASPHCHRRGRRRRPVDRRVAP